MPYSLQVDTDDAREFATIDGLRQLTQWAEGLPDETSIELQHLLAHGWSQELAELRQGLRDSVELRPPPADVGEVVQAILDATRDDAEVVSLTDGLGTSAGGPHAPGPPAKAFDEAQHPRDERGRFGESGEGDGGLHTASRVTERDAASLGELLRAAVPGVEKNGTDGPHLAYTALVADNAEHRYAARDPSGAVSAAGSANVLDDEEGGQFLFVVNLGAVRGGNGAGTAVMVSMMEHARQKGLSMALDSLPGAKKFYEKLGFKYNSDADLHELDKKQLGTAISRAKEALAAKKALTLDDEPEDGGFAKEKSRRARTKEFDESKHPRDDKGKFSDTGGLGSSGSKYTVPKGSPLDKNHPAVVHITKQLKHLYKVAQTLDKTSKEYKENRALASKLKKDRQKLWDEMATGKPTTVTPPPKPAYKPPTPYGSKPKPSPYLYSPSKEPESGPTGLDAPVPVPEPPAHETPALPLASAGGPVPFETDAEWKDWMRKSSEKAQGKYSYGYKGDSPMGAVETWVGSASYCRNDQRENEKTGKPLKPETLALEMAVARAPRPDSPIYRGIGLGNEGLDGEALKKFLTVGQEIRTNTHDSWSTSSHKAGQFGLFKPNHILLRMPKSTTGGDISSLSSLKEYETIVPKHTRYRVTKVELNARGKNKHTVHVEEIGYG